MARILLLTALAPAAWGTTYLVTTELMPADRPLLVAMLRVLPIGILLTAAGRRLPTGAWWWRSAVLGTLNIGAFQALLFVAAYRLPGGVAATAGAIQPLVAAALAAALLGERFGVRTGSAGIAGVVGVGLLVLRPEAALDPLGIAAALTGTVFMAVGVVLTKRWSRPVGLLTATGWQLSAGGLLLLPLTLLVEGRPPILTAANWLGAGWLAVVGTGLAYVLWFRGVERLPVNRLSFLGLISPVVATTLGWVVLHQSLTPAQLAGAALIAGAVVAPQLRRRGDSHLRLAGSVRTSSPARHPHAPPGRRPPAWSGTAARDGSVPRSGSAGRRRGLEPPPVTVPCRTITTGPVGTAQ